MCLNERRKKVKFIIFHFVFFSFDNRSDVKNQQSGTFTNKKTTHLLKKSENKASELIPRRLILEFLTFFTFLASIASADMPCF